MKNRSTISNLYCITQLIGDALDDYVQIEMIYTEFSKGFGELDDKTLLCNFHNLGLD